MKRTHHLLLLLAGALTAPLTSHVASAQEGSPAAPAIPHSGVPAGNCDLMASNTLRATYVGPVREGETAAYRFTVIETIAYKASNRYANLPLKQGQTLDIPADPSRPGQPADVLAGMAEMKPGEEVIMLINHIFLFAEPYYGNQIVCTRLARLGVLTADSRNDSGFNSGTVPLPPADGAAANDQPPYGAQNTSQGSQLGNGAQGSSSAPLPADKVPPPSSPLPPHRAQGGDDTIIESGTHPSDTPTPPTPTRPLLPEDEGF